VLLAEGEEHKRQRKLLTPSFSPQHVKSLVPVFWDKTEMLVQKLNEQVDQKGDGVVIEMTSWLSKCTLDIIGAAGFGYDFDSMNRETEVVEAYTGIFNPPTTALRMVRIATSVFPFLFYLPLQVNGDFKKRRQIIRDTCENLVQSKKVALKEGKGSGKDILGNMISQGIWSDSEMHEQIMTFLAAGHETTASATTWALYLLSQHVDVQTKLRKEVTETLSNLSGAATHEDFESMAYLSQVIQEVMRFIPPVPVTFRETRVDTELEGVMLPKGTHVVIAAAAIHRDHTLWGPTADQFDPDRWKSPPESNYAYEVFLNGPRGCIGRRFAESEFKTILALLVYNFEFHEEYAGKTYEIKNSITSRPKGGMQLRVSRVT